MTKILQKRFGIAVAISFLLISAATIVSNSFDNLSDIKANRDSSGDYTLVLNGDNGQITGIYPSSVATNNTAKTTDGNTIQIKYYDCGFFSNTPAGSYAQMKKSSGYFYNSSTLDAGNKIYPLSNITSITATFTNSTPTLYLGNSENPTTNSQTMVSGTKITVSGYDYFKIVAGSSATYLSSLTITYSCGTGGSDSVLQSINIADGNTSYQVGTIYSDVNDLTVTGIYNTGSSLINSGYTINGDEFDPYTAFETTGTYSVSVTYNSITSNSIDITVVEASGSSVPTNIQLNQSSVSLTVGNSTTLIATLTPVDAVTVISWSTSSSSVATVSTSGVVTAVAAGTATITALTSNSLSATCLITVTASSAASSYRIQFVTSGTSDNSTSLTSSTFSLQVSSGSGYISSYSSITRVYAGNGGLKLGSGSGAGSFTLGLSTSGQVQATRIVIAAKKYSSDTTTISMNSMTSQDVSNSSYTEMTYNIADPTATLTTLSLSSTGKRAYLSYIDVFYGTPDPVAITNLALSASTLAVPLNGTSSLTTTVSPTNAYPEPTISWSSNNTNVATVNNGTITGVATGTATITAQATQTGGPILIQTCAVTVSAVSVTGVTLDKTTSTVALGSSGTLVATVSPSNASNKTVTWSSSNSSVATVSNGTVNGIAIGTATITAKTQDGNYTATCLVSVEEIVDDYTIMIYMCGSDLETNYSLATGNITEILSVNYPAGVNVIIETGGAKTWASTYGINKSYLERYHVANKALVRDAQLTKASMGATATFQSFLEWGLNNYPAKKTGVVMWDHGGAMDGCCYDENYSYDSLLNSEVHTALGNAFTNVGRTDKLDWIGYDVCLFGVADIADFNSDYFDYMVASQESEPGEGWDYDVWLGAIATNPEITAYDVGKKIADSFITKCGGTSSSSNDATMAVLDLSKMDAYSTAWETMAEELNDVITSSSVWNTFKTLVNSCQQFGYDSSSGYTWDIFDLQDWCDNMQASSTFKNVDTVDAVETAFKAVVVYNTYGKASSDASGLCLFCAISGYTSKSSSYSTAQTNYTVWRNLLIAYGSFAS